MARILIVDDHEEERLHLWELLRKEGHELLFSKDGAIALYENMISHIIFLSPLKKMHQDMAAKNTKGQSSLWSYGISGDLPIVLVAIANADDIALVQDVINAHEYWWLKSLHVDLVILANLESGYCRPFHDQISDMESGQTHGIGKSHVLNVNEIPADDVYLLYAAARIVLKDDGRTLKEQMNTKPEPTSFKDRRFAGMDRKYAVSTRDETSSLTFFNGLGGFRADGAAYIIHLNEGQNTPAPWVNVIANPGFGFLVSESGSSCTWCGNSRENKLTPLEQ